MKLLQIRKSEHVALQITPDSSVRNWRTEDITRAIADGFKLPIDRLGREGKTITVESAHVFAFEMVFENGEVKFFFHAPHVVSPVYTRRMLSVWSDATVEPQDRSKPLGEASTAVYELVYKQHDLYSLHTDAKDNSPLQSILEAGRLLMDINEEGKEVWSDDRARVFALFEPIHQPTWRAEMEMRWQKLREGHSPKKFDTSIRNLTKIGAVGIASTLKEVVTGVSELIGSGNDNIYKDKPVDPLAMQYALERLTQATRKKIAAPAIRTYIWTAAESDSKTRADMIARALASAFGDLGADNELTPRPLKRKAKEKALESMKKISVPQGLTYNVLSAAEAAKIVQVPGRELQEKYREVVCKQMKETYVDPLLTAGGILLGEVTHKGVKQKFYQPLPPINTPWDDSAWDTPLQTRVAIGPPGSGKSTVGTNFIVEAKRYGLGSIFIDPAKGTVGDEAEKVLPNVKRFNLAKVAYGLDWCEAKHAGKAFKDVLADAVTAFFDDGAGAQTNRFLEAAIHAMTTTKLREIVHILRNKQMREKAIQSMPQGNIHREDLEEYNGYGPDRQRQIAAPIFNRLNVVLGNSWLSECMNSDNSIDLVEEMSKPQTIIFDVLAKDGLTPKQIDILVNLISTKIMLAMKLRTEENQIPYWIVYDEPHQMVRSTAIWESAVVEARKWRLAYIFLFHEWMQIPDKLRAIIKGVQPHYHLYAGTSKRIWQDLKEEIYPIEIEEAMQMKKYHAVNVIQTEDGANPIIVHMADKPSGRKEDTFAKSTTK